MNIDNKGDIDFPIIIGKVIVTTAVQASFGSLELPSRLMIRKFITTQEDADAFIEELQGYLFLGSLWAIGTTIIMYDMHEYRGAIINLLLQILAMSWIIYRRYSVYLGVVKKNNFKIKSVFS